MHIYPIEANGSLKNHKEITTVLSTELERAFKSTGCDMRCFDWLSYNPDFYIQQKTKKVS